jgi:hypothetical protein
MICGPRQAEPLVGSARRCPTAETMSFNTPSTKRGGRPRRGKTTGRGRAEERASAHSSNLAPLRGSGGEARFGLALEWTDDPADRQRRQAPASTEEAALDPAEIAVELGLSGPLTQDQLVSHWRDFVWRNHPDRQPAHARKSANARVAIANTLYDRARRELVRRR